MPEGVKLEGWRILQQYHSQFIAPLQQWCPPLGIEGKIEGSLIVQGLEFRLTGRYDRLDLLDHRDLLTAQIDLIDYKTGHTPLDPQNLALDLQLGIYQIALEQVYGRSLRQLTHIYLRSGQVVRYAANDSQRATLLAKVQDIAMTLIEDRTFTPNPGNHCQRCACRAYCPTQPAPIPLAPTAMGLQLSLLALT
jgi:putative RecB family exonuclease